jgi:zinc transport system substrate-binding protein
MVWEGEPLTSVVARLEELGITSVVFAPGGNVPEEGDLLSVMGANADRLEAAWVASPDAG